MLGARCMACTTMVCILKRRLDTLCPANPQNALVIGTDAMIAFQIVSNATISFIGRFIMNLLNDFRNLFIFSGAIADAPGCPPVIGCSGNMKNPACSFNRVSKLCVTLTNRCIQLLLPYFR